ncbi:hypothetical protein M422DRAFT_245576 [Sphaerobolus stellatus SS14]|nr:hypothetical protein M422DRAFT_245576 [Sphaerobolus stellatus SS14]
MFALNKLLPTILLALAVSAAVTNVVPPASRGQSNPSNNTLDLTGTVTDAGTIAQTVDIVDQKAGVPVDAAPNLPVAETVVTAVDGQLTSAGTSSKRSLASRSFATRKRAPSDYEQIFNGTGTDPSDRDASIEGTAYLTYTVVPNSTYNIDACLDFCDRVDGCVFVNLYYEFFNPLLDFVFSEQSNLKCAAYADIHSAAEKTNFGGQQLEPAPAPLNFIQQSSGFAAKALVEPTTPDGYSLVFGPTGGANNAPGYMGFVFIDKYDVEACAQICNTRQPDPNGGACQYFNIWRAVVSGIPTTYTCSLYFIPTDNSTAVNFGQGDLVVTLSRGYKRTNLVIDGGFEGFPCNTDFCFADSYANWIGTSAPGGVDDATIFFFAPFAHAGNGVALLGSADATDNLTGTLTPAKPLTTVAGKTYSINLFSSSVFSGPQEEAASFFQIVWNGQTIQTVTPGFSDWTFYTFSVTAAGNDVLAIHGGSAPAWSFFDDVAVFES